MRLTPIPIALCRKRYSTVLDQTVPPLASLRTIASFGTNRVIQAIGAQVGGSMRRWLIGAIGLVVLALGLLQFRNGLFELFPGLGADREVQTAAQKATKAADDFAALSRDAYRTGNVPRQSDPAAGALLDAVFNVDLLKAKMALAKADLGSLADWSAAQGKVGSVYIFSGTGISDPSRATNDPALRQQVDHNTAEYAQELGRYMDAELFLQGKTLDVIEASGTSSDRDNASVKKGLDDVRSGVTTTISGVISTFAVNGINDDWRRERLAALNALAPKASKLLLPEQCKPLQEIANTVRQSMSDASVQDGLRNFSDALKC